MTEPQTRTKYTYDASGLRVEKTASAVELDYLYDLSGNAVSEWMTSSGYTGWSTEYMYFNGALASEYKNDTAYFVHQDHLGSARLLTGVGSNLIPNPGFEQGESDWVDWESNYVQLVDNPSLAHSGNYYAQLSWSGTGGPSVISQTLAVQPGDQPSFGGWVNLQSGGGGSLGWLIETQDANHNALSWPKAGASPTTSGWQFQTGEYTVPAGVAYVFLYATVWNPSSSTVLLVDDGFLYDDRTSVQTVQNLDYLPFGELNSTDSGITTHEFTGNEQDAETNLAHTQFRQYSSSMARWMTPDPAGLAAVDPTDPQTWNRYAYVRNIPVILSDSLGLTPSCNTAKTNESQPDNTSAGGPSATESDSDLADPEAPQQGSGCTVSPWYYSDGGGGGVAGLDGGYNGDDSGFGVGSPLGYGGGMAGAIEFDQSQIPLYTEAEITSYLNFWEPQIDDQGNLTDNIRIYQLTWHAWETMQIGTGAIFSFNQVPDFGGGNNSGPYYNPAIPQSVLKGIGYQLRYAVVQQVCGQNEDRRLLRSMRNGAIVGATKGAYSGFVSGELFGGEVTLGASGLGGAALGGFVGGTVGAMKGVFIGTAAALVCKAGGAYN